MTTSEPTTGEIVDDLKSLIRIKPQWAPILRTAIGAIAALTARAEQAEAREKAVLEDMKDYCQFCWHCDKNDDEEPCKTCENVTHDGSESKWTWRGQPQDGEGDESRADRR